MPQIRINHTKSTSILVYEAVIHVTTDEHPGAAVVRAYFKIRQTRGKVQCE
jgi:hypothetical protein